MKTMDRTIWVAFNQLPIQILHHPLLPNLINWDIVSDHDTNLRINLTLHSVEYTFLNYWAVVAKVKFITWIEGL